MAWERRITHAGLNTYRLIRGQSQGDVNMKARLQLAQWEERWQAKSRAQKSRADHITGKDLALERTLELERQREALQMLLANAVKSRVSFDLEALKPHSPFEVKPPLQPKLQALPPPLLPPPQRPEAQLPQRKQVEPVVPVWNLSERVIPLLRKKKLAAAEEETKQLLASEELSYQKLVAANEAADQERKREEQEFRDAERAHMLATEATIKANEALKAAYQSDVQVWQAAKAEFLKEQQEVGNQIDQLKYAYLAGDPSAIKAYFYEVLAGSSYPDAFPREHLLELVPEKTLVLDFELPNSAALPALKEVKYVAARACFQEVPASDAWLKKTYDEVIYQICLRTLWEVFTADSIDAVQSIVFNGWVRSIDRSTGSNVHACVMSLEAGKDEFLAINLAQVEPKACFKKLKGVSASKLIELSPVKPLVSVSKEDKRFVEGYAVVDAVDHRTNLAAMDWLDFENLIREVFEKEFSKGGGEVKITQASRDGGVDAVAFDPDPIRGGKVVIQAKRYTNTVGVGAVRDLYGTVHNEGANKGILVTTSDFGPDAYAFAKGKPLTLLSGGELLYLLGQHGHAAKIDLAEAKRIAAENA